MKPLALYLDNLRLHWKAYPGIFEFGYARTQSRWKSILLWCFLYWTLDVGTATLTGHAPYESWSSIWAKDRNTFFGKIFTEILDWIDPGHTERALNPEVGEGSPYNRELPWQLRVALAAWYLALILLFTLM